jgi:hypothetical protein
MRRRTILPFSLGIVFASLGAPLPNARAQSAEAPAPPIPSEECQVAPLDEAAPPSAGESLTDTLAPCDGVLAPPPVGDPEIAVDPPALGETPIIPPGLLPPQPPQAE